MFCTYTPIIRTSSVRVHITVTFALVTTATNPLERHLDMKKRLRSSKLSSLKYKIQGKKNYEDDFLTMNMKYFIENLQIISSFNKLKRIKRSIIYR